MMRFRFIAALFTILILALGMCVFFACGGAEEDEDDEDEGDGMPDLTWIAVSGGSFSMGCSPNDADCQPERVNDNETPFFIV